MEDKNNKNINNTIKIGNINIDLRDLINTSIKNTNYNSIISNNSNNNCDNKFSSSTKINLYDESQINSIINEVRQSLINDYETKLKNVQDDQQNEIKALYARIKLLESGIIENGGLICKNNARLDEKTFNTFCIGSSDNNGVQFENDDIKIDKKIKNQLKDLETQVYYNLFI